MERRGLLIAALFTTPAACAGVFVYLYGESVWDSFFHDSLPDRAPGSRGGLLGVGYDEVARPPALAAFHDPVDAKLHELETGTFTYGVDEQCLKAQIAGIRSLQAELSATYIGYERIGLLYSEEAKAQIDFLKRTIKAKLLAAEDLTAPWVPGKPRFSCI